MPSFNRGDLVKIIGEEITTGIIPAGTEMTLSHPDQGDLWKAHRILNDTTIEVVVRASNLQRINRASQSNGIYGIPTAY